MSSVRSVRINAALAATAAAVALLTLVRTKIVAIELGPEGVGALTLVLSLLALVTMLAQAGLQGAGIREIGAARLDGRAVGEIRWGLRVGLSMLAVVSGAAVALSAEFAAEELLGDGDLEGPLRVGALSTAVTVAGAAIFADLYGLRRSRLLAAVQITGALMGTVVVASVAVLDGPLLEAVVVGPPCAVGLALVMANRRLPAVARIPLRRWLPRFRATATLGVVFMINGVVAALGGLVLRLLVDADLGAGATGEFQAAFIIATTLTGFFLVGLDADYMPRLAAVADRLEDVRSAVDRQLTVTALLALPAVTVVAAGAEVLVPILYSGEFSEASDLLRLMLVGDIARVLAWTIGYVLVARRARLAYLATELLFNAALIGAAALLLAPLGITGAAVAYLIAQALNLAWTMWFVRRSTGYGPDRQATLVILACIATVAMQCVAAEVGGVGTLVAWGTASVVTIGAGLRLKGWEALTSQS